MYFAGVPENYLVFVDGGVQQTNFGVLCMRNTQMRSQTMFNFHYTV